MKTGPCRHCGRSKVNRPRGLCWSCYYTPGVKDQYPSTSKFANHGEGSFYGAGLIPEPTTALPATPEKVEVLARRVERRQALWHPRDARRTDRSPPVVRSLAMLADRLPAWRKQRRAARPAAWPSLAERILAVLGESPIPMTTPDLAAILPLTGGVYGRQAVWVALRRLAAGGLVEGELRLRPHRGERGHRRSVTYWQLKSTANPEGERT